MLGSFENIARFENFIMDRRCRWKNSRGSGTIRFEGRHYN